MKANTYKKLLMLSFLALLVLVCITSYFHSNRGEVYSSGLKGTKMSTDSSVFNRLFTFSVNRHEQFTESLKMLSKNSTWGGRSLILPRQTLVTDFRIDEDIAHFRETGGLDIVSLSKFSMDAYMEGWEWDVLDRPALGVAMDAGNGTTSSMTIVNETSSYRVGDVITIRVDIKDGNGKQKKEGGDQVRVWITDTQNQAFQASDVIDMGNGSYIADIPFSWAGKISIKASLQYNADIQRSHFFLRNIMKTVRFMFAGFQSSFSSEATPCSPFPVIPSFSQLCNFTNENGGLPWYCGKPRNSALDCRHWKYNFDSPFTSPLPLTPAEMVWSALSQLSKDDTIQDITLHVSPKSVASYERPKPKCGSLRVEKSWTGTAPRGFFKNRIWYPSACTLPVMSTASLANCLRDTTILMVGDSNLRLAYQVLVKRLQCKPGVTPHWHTHHYCYHKSTKTSVNWYPHALPFHLGGDIKYASRHNLKPANEYVDEIPSHGNFIVLIHLYLHFTPHHYSVFSTHISAIRRSVEKLLIRNPRAKVIIRGPHTANNFKDWYGLRGGEIAGLQYTDIIKREFKGIYDKVFFLQPWDMTVAIDNYEFHPPDYVNEAMMNLVLDFACSNP